MKNVSLRRFYALSILSIVLVLSGCSNSQTKLHQYLSKEDPKHISYAGHYKIGDQYKIKNQSYKPAVNINYDEVGIACWYGSKDSFHGKKTANGDTYNKAVLSAAHRTLPLPSLVKVTNLTNNKSLIVNINDRGPFHKNRLIDVSERAAEILGFKKQGIAKVRIQYLHEDTKRFLNNISLVPGHNKKPRGKISKSRCSINCHVKLVNMKHKLAFVP
ncbi:MAG: septal ring lytic transglycosylase RlpA family protein [Janthinobacterium lividum]